MIAETNSPQALFVITTLPLQSSNQHHEAAKLAAAGPTELGPGTPNRFLAALRVLKLLVVEGAGLTNLGAQLLGLRRMPTQKNDL